MGVTLGELKNSLKVCAWQIYKNYFFSWSCKDQRYLARQNGSNDKPTLNIAATCNWYNQFNITPRDLVCIIDHCGHPHQGIGSHLPPPTENALTLIETNFTKAHNVPLGHIVTYKCKPNAYFENEEIDPTMTNASIKCLESNGTYQVPDKWPNCTATVSCGKPIDPPINGSIVWLNGTNNEVKLFLKSSIQSKMLRL